MMKTYPDLMNELIEYIKIDCPTIIVHNTTFDDFPEGCSIPPSEEIVA